MKFENVKVYGFEGAIRGMRNAKESWDKSDSIFGIISLQYLDKSTLNPSHPNKDFDILQTSFQGEPVRVYNEDIHSQLAEFVAIGPRDMKLAQNLIRAGSEHRKFLRQIMVSVDITAPIYWQNSFCQ